MANLAIKGHETRGKEVIEILEMLGGINTYKINYTEKNLLYCLREGDNVIIATYPNTSITNIFTLEEFLEKFPYKVGDKVLYKTYGIYSRIKSMLWNEEKEQVFYRLESNKLFVATADELKPYKKEVMEEIKIDIPKGYEFAGVDDNAQQVVFTKIGHRYPRTYKECCDVLNDARGYKADLIIRLQQLLIARDAWLKIAGDEYQLGKPLEPCWEDETEIYYTISYDGVNIKCYNNTDAYSKLAFPTEQMRDAFYENFKDLIEGCKELL